VATMSAHKQSGHEREEVEMLCAYVERTLTLDRLRLRDPAAARDEFLLPATPQTLRRMAARLMTRFMTQLMSRDNKMEIVTS
jgi:hypothetical protein